jgi:hypothetical protein
MRIIGIRWQPVSRIFCIIYAVLGLCSFLYWLFTDIDSLTLPFGVVAPLVYLNLNLHLPRPTGLPMTFAYGLADIAAYAASGWITGAFVALVFNFVAKRMGGINAEYLITEEPAKQQGE